jgi:heat shock protein HslJ
MQLRRYRWVWIGLAFLLAGLVALQVFMRSTPADLRDSTWQLQELRTTAGALVFAPDRPGVFTLRFGDGLGGRDSCNSYGGDYSINRLTGGLSIGQMMSTLMACLDNPLERWDSVFATALSHASRYELEGDILRIYADQDGQALVFRRASDYEVEQ